MKYGTETNSMFVATRAFIRPGSDRRGFTLTEMLVVIIIVALLASITSYVILGARDTAKASIIKVQLVQLSMALDMYKQKYGEYPPDFSDEDAVMRHVQKRWPRYGITTYAQFAQHITWGSRLSFQLDLHTSRTGGTTPFSLNLGGTDNFWYFTNNTNFQNTNPAPCCYASALVFWLGGLPGANGTPVGFFNNPKAPLGFDRSVTTVAAATAAWNNINVRPVQREETFFEFPEGTVVTRYGIPCYNLDEKPVLYFRATSQIYDAGRNMGAYALPMTSRALRNDSTTSWCDVTAGLSTKFYFFPLATDLGIAVPYARDTPGQWYGQDSFQLVHPGRDGSFGLQDKVDYAYPPRAPGMQANLSMEDNDNITNFLEKGTTLESEFK